MLYNDPPFNFCFSVSDFFVWLIESSPIDQRFKVESRGRALTNDARNALDIQLRSAMLKASNPHKYLLNDVVAIFEKTVEELKRIKKKHTFPPPLVVLLLLLGNKFFTSERGSIFHDVAISDPRDLRVSHTIIFP